MTLPSIGFGTSPYKSGAAPVDVEEAVRIALQAGYRLFDVAEAYGNERTVGRALHGADAPPRSELHLIGKVWHTNFAPRRLRRACKDSLHRLGVERFDLYLLHAPDAWRYVAPLDDAEKIGWDELLRRGTPRAANGSIISGDVPVVETWAAMRDLVPAGLAGRVGVSNFTPKQIDSLGNAPDANEIACWPLEPSVLQWHSQHEIMVLGYSPLKTDILEAEAVRNVASACRRAPAQVILRWLIQSGVRPLTSSANPEHIRENLGALEFELSADQMATILTAVRR
ncbi:MAG: aldo/keto reductase [Acidobacteriota bacterium]|nr:aldo/keto reductase [Acidobacteriota bacterium]